MTTTLTVLSPLDIRNAYLRVVRAELIARGVPSPNVLKGSEYYARAEALAQQIAPCMANAVSAAEINMPDTAVGERLIRWLTMYGLSFRPAQPSNGNVVFSSSASSYVGVDKQLVDDRGQFYQVTTGATYANGALIPIQAISTGAATNRIEGTVLQWVSPPTYANPRANVAVGGLRDGADADTETIALARLLARMQQAIGGGNWAQTVAWAEEVIAGTYAYVYPALNGPSTYGLWILGQLSYGATHGFSRQISDANRTLIANAVLAAKPEHAELTMPALGADLSIADTPTDVSIGLSLPLAVAAGGPGGGWTDSVPWPSLAGTATRVTVSSVASATQFVLSSNDAASTPDPATIVDGTTQIAWFDPSQFNVTDGAMILTSTIVSHSGTTGNVTVNIDPINPFVNITAGDWVFPNCANAEAYARAWLAAMAAMGPGEWTADINRVPRANRRPLATLSAPSALSAQQTRAIENAGNEVANATYLYRSVSSPAIPADTTTASPLTLVPGRRLAFYPE